MKNKALLLPRLLFLVLAIADSIYLLFIESGYASCSVLGKSTCITILPVYSNHLFIPLPIMGLIGYSMLLAVTLLALKRPKFQLLRRLAAICAFLFSVYLMSFMFFIVHNICPFCVISFLLISGFAFLEFVELSKKTLIKLAILLTLGILIVVSGVYFVSLSYQPSKIFEKRSSEFVNNSKPLDLDYMKVYNESEKPLLIFIYSPRCPFCEYYASEVLSDPELKTAFNAYSFYTLDATLYNGFYKSIETKENSVPMLVIWTKKGKLDFLNGMRKKKDVLEFIHQR